MKISIITVNFNNCKGLEETLESVASQTCRDFEHIIIDGGSTDGSKEVIEKYAKHIAYWISEPDKGVYNAMNKGVAAANGEYCLFVNSGDKLHSCDTIAQIIAHKPSSDIVVGSVMNVSTTGSCNTWRPFTESKISLVYLRDNPIHHPGALIRLSLQKETPYNENLKICSDRQFFIEALILKNCTYSTINVVINTFAPAGLSSKDQDERMNTEDSIIMNKLFPERLLRDIDCTNGTIQKTTKLMMHHYRFTNILCSFNNFILKTIGGFAIKL